VGRGERRGGGEVSLSRGAQKIHSKAEWQLNETVETRKGAAIMAVPLFVIGSDIAPMVDLFEITNS